MSESIDIDARLAAINRDRAWLAEKTPYSGDYIRTVLAPNSKRRTKRVLQILLAAIMQEEALLQAKTPETIPLLDRIVLEVPTATHDRWASAAASQSKTVKNWAIEELNKAADQWHRDRGLRVAQDPHPYQAPKKNGGTASAS